MYIKIPFQIVSGCVEQEEDLKKSVDSFIDLLVSTQFGQFKADPDFGFIFKNHRFENFDEKKGTIATRNENEQLKELKIEGTSKNPMNFANALKRNIEEYEKRLLVKEVVMEYDKKRHNIKLLISGALRAERQIPYSHEINFYVW